MKNTLSNIFIFAAGAAIGSIITWKVVEEKYKQIAQEEIDSVKEVFSRRTHKDESEPVEETASISPAEKEEYNDIASKYDSTQKEKGGSEYMKNDLVSPYVISPDEFGENDDYDTVSLTYYTDGVLADDDFEEIEDIEGTVGLDSLETFGEYEEDSVFVRNDENKTDYEILMDYRPYADAISTTPNLTDDE